MTAVDVAAAGRARARPTLLEPHRTVERIDAVALSGGSAFGLDAGGASKPAARTRPRLSSETPGAVCGARSCSTCSMAATRTGAASRLIGIGYAAASEAATTFRARHRGAGLGATTVNLKGGMGSASAVTRGRPYRRGPRRCERGRQRHVGQGPRFWAARSRSTTSSAAQGFPATLPPAALVPTSRDARARTRPSPSSPPMRR